MYRLPHGHPPYMQPLSTLQPPPGYAPQQPPVVGSDPGTYMPPMMQMMPQMYGQMTLPPQAYVPPMVSEPMKPPFPTYLGMPPPPPPPPQSHYMMPGPMPGPSMAQPVMPAPGQLQRQPVVPMPSVNMALPDSLPFPKPIGYIAEPPAHMIKVQDLEMQQRLEILYKRRQQERANEQQKLDQQQLEARERQQKSQGQQQLLEQFKASALAKGTSELAFKVCVLNFLLGVLQKAHDAYSHEYEKLRLMCNTPTSDWDFIMQMEVIETIVVHLRGTKRSLERENGIMEALMLECPLPAESQEKQGAHLTWISVKHVIEVYADFEAPK